eukprot:scaffold1034_cov418-Prasinococcus_capsulatus_cf.AAC.31
MRTELEKLESLEPASGEFNVTRTYLDWLTSIPWGTFSEETYSITSAENVLEEDHFGMEDVKKRILEFIAVGKLTKKNSGKIICLSGPPGVGKTSIGKSIARALGREFFRFSVGGLGDVAEIRGHRRTYVGAMPGKLVQCLKSTGVMNPLVLIDEVDKLGDEGRHRGDPSSALLEMLDPVQNSAFMDHYLDVPVDLSQVLFICTANYLQSIPVPLLDRMEVIELAGYIPNEKMEIARKYLIPKAKSDSGVAPSVQITDEGLEHIIQGYCREAGVRKLEQQLNKIFRFEALEEARRQEVGGDGSARSPAQGADVIIGREEIHKYLGVPKYKSTKYEALPVGVSIGLSWSMLGGSTMEVETSIVDSKPGSGRITGQLGKVMSESVLIAQTVAQQIARDLSGTEDILATV